jgi:hypothetical protein
MKLSEADAFKYTSSLTKRLVIIDAKTKQVLEKKPLITLGRQLEFLLVSNENDPRNIAESNILGFSIEDFTDDRSIGISVKYRVSCPVGDEEKVALALLDDNTKTPGVVFEGKLINWLKDYVSRKIRFSDFITNYAQQLESLQAHAVDKARETGLNLRIKLSLDESNELKAFSVNLRDFPILMNDFEKEINFRFRANLSITDDGKVNAILSYRQLGNLKDILQNATQTYLRNNICLEDFYFKFDDFVRPQLISHLNQELISHGRQIEGFFPEFSNGFDLKSLSVESDNFPVILSDFEEEIEFKFRANLSISKSEKVNAILRYEQLGELKNILQEEVRMYLRENASLYSFCYDFENSIRKGLVAHLDKVLAYHGRRLEGFFPSPELIANLQMPEPDSIQCDVRHDIQGYGVVVIKNTLDVEPKRQDSGKYWQEGILKYRKARVVDVREWFRTRLEKTIHRYLFDFSYVDILLKYDPQAIKAQLDKDAENIGYSIRLISTVPDLKPLKLRTEGFKFESSETFSTKQNSVKIKLGIDVRGKIENLESIKDILNDPQNDVDNLIAKDVIDSIKRVLHGVEPADFYAQEGLIAYVNDYSSRDAIKDKIAKTIEASLKEKFGASSQVALQALNTELLDLINELTGGANHNFEMLLSSTRDAGEKVLFTGLFQINGVAKDQWETFASRKPSVEDVKKSIQDCLRAWFSTLSSSTLNYTTTKGLLKLLADANSLAGPKIMQNYGLLVSIEGLEAPDTQLKARQRELQLYSEIKILEEAEEEIKNDARLRENARNTSLNQMTHLNQELESVRGLLQALITQPGGEERKKQLREREKELNNQLSDLIEANRKRSADITSKQIQRSIQQSTDESDFDELIQDSKASLPEGSMRLDSKPPGNSLPSDDQVIDV